MDTVLVPKEVYALSLIADLLTELQLCNLAVRREQTRATRDDEEPQVSTLRMAALSTQNFRLNLAHKIFEILQAENFGLLSAHSTSPPSTMPYAGV